MTAPKDIPDRIAAALERIERLTRSDGQRTADRLALSPLQMRVLGVLRSKGPARVGDLARELMVTPGTVSEAVRVLEEKALVRKEPDPEEHRAVQVHLTRRGQGAAKRAGRLSAETLGPVLASMGTEGSGELLGSLLRFLQALERQGLIETTRMCSNCEHFRPWKGRGGKPHYCALIEDSIGKAELQVDCPEFELAGPDRLAERWEQLAEGD